MFFNFVFRNLRKLFISNKTKNDGTNVERTGNFHLTDVKFSFNELSSFMTRPLFMLIATFIKGFSTSTTKRTNRKKLYENAHLLFMVSNLLTTD